MFPAHSKTNETRRNSAKDREPLEQPKNERHFVEHRPTNNEWRQHLVVNQFLRGLNDARWKHSSLLNLLKHGIEIGSRCQGLGKDIRGSDGILDCEIDADTAHR